jgi:Asp-tRNA(Asn)/Glu-tRNA(Gln) amidotransferase A subunit family amidase
MATTIEETRRRFMTHFASIGLGSSLVPGVVWARMQDQGTERVTLAMVTEALRLQGIELPEADRQAMVNGANQNLARYEEVRKIHIPLDVSPPFHFSALAPGVEPNRTRMPFRASTPPAVRRPANLEDVAFWPVRHLAELVRTRQVKSVELTEMYLGRLHRYQPRLNFVVTFLDDMALAQARQADTEIAAGKYRGLLHGIPWGAKDIISVKGYPTTWGSAAFKEQVFDYDASVVEMLRDAGAVLIAKLTTGELASGDQWFGGRTNSPWDPAQGSSGSSAGPCSATAAGCVGFGIGTETSGSILSPSARCGVTGLRPTFGRISRYGVMALSWTQDRLGPICRYAEDCAIVMQAIAKLDGRDMSVSDIPFNWDARLDVRKLRVGVIKESFDGLSNADAKTNAETMLEMLRSIGVTNFVEMKIPEGQTNVSSLGVESFVYFDELRRNGKLTGSRMGGNRPTARLLPAVEYLQQQRLRMMMMTELAAATAGVDVYLVAANPSTGGAGGGRGGRGRGADDPDDAARGRGGDPAGARGGDPAGARGGEPGRGRGRGGGGGPANPAGRHSTMANLACYPALNVPSGFTAAGTPTHVTFFARPFGETELLALGKAYQDIAKHHLRKPQKLDVDGAGVTS